MNGLKSIQVTVTDEEHELFTQLKELRGWKNNRNAILTMVSECLKNSKKRKTKKVRA